MGVVDPEELISLQVGESIPVIDVMLGLRPPLRIEAVLTQRREEPRDAISVYDDESESVLHLSFQFQTAQSHIFLWEFNAELVLSNDGERVVSCLWIEEEGPLIDYH